MGKINGFEKAIDNFKGELQKCLEIEITRQLEQMTKTNNKKEDLYKYFYNLGYKIEEKKALKWVFIKEGNKRDIRISYSNNTITFHNYEFINLNAEVLKKITELAEVLKLNDK